MSTAMDATAASPPRLSSTGVWGHVAVITGAVVLLALVFIRMMNVDIRNDELLYTAPIGFQGDLALYRDVFFNHMPGSAWLTQGFANLLGWDEVLLSGRLLVFAFWAMLVVSIVLVTLAMTNSATVLAFVLALFLGNELFLSAPGMAATNNVLLVPLGFAGLGAFMLGTLYGRVDVRLVVLSGALLAAAASLKVSAIAFVIPVVIAAFVAPMPLSYGARFMRVILPLAVAGGVIASPTIIVFLNQPELFLAHVVHYHTGPHVQYWAENAHLEPSLAFSLSQKLRLVLDVWFRGAALVFLVVASAMCLLVGATNGRALLKAPVAFSLLTFAFVFSFSLIPTPSFPQYFMPVFAVAPLVVLSLYQNVPHEQRATVATIVAASAILMLFANAPRYMQHLPRAASPSTWGTISIHHDGETVADTMAASGVGSRLATLFPIYAYEGGLRPYPEFATGPFGTRVMPLVAPDLGKYYQTVSPDAVGTLFTENPPDALLLGFNPRLEENMYRYAKEHNYIEVPLDVKNRYGSGVLYVRPTKN